MMACVGDKAIRPTVPVLVSAGGVTLPTYALLDTGANCAAVTDSLCLKINAPLKTLNIRLKTFDQNSVSQREVASFKVSNLNNTFSINIQDALVGQFLSAEGERPTSRLEARNYEHLKDKIFNDLEDPSVGVLLDAKHAWTFMTGQVCVGGENEPIGVETKFGWALIGPTNGGGRKITINDDLCTLDADLPSYADQIRRLFRHNFIQREGENFPSEQVHMSVNDEFSLEQMENTIRKNPKTGHYIVGLPWRLGRQETADLFGTIDFYAGANSRHEKMKKKLKQDPILKAGAFAQMASTLEQGHAKILENLEAPENSPICYLPNHIVTRPDKPGKFRICQDAAARVGKHFLNKYLLSGPDFLNKLVTVLLRFRRKKVVLSADIGNFFYQIEVDPLDRSAMRYLWWEDEEMKKTVVIEALVHIFGAASSPAVANYVLRHHAENIRSRYPEEVYWTILLCFYVDDLLTSVDTVEEAKNLKEMLIESLKLGGFDLLKWRSNYPELSDESIEKLDSPIAPTQASTHDSAGTNPSPSSLPDVYNLAPENCNDKTLEVDAKEKIQAGVQNWDARQPDSSDAMEEENPNDLVGRVFGPDGWEEDTKELLSESPDKILGVGYDYEKDEMHIRIGDKHEREVRTKQEVLSWISSVYDPFGHVSPYVLPGKKFFQQINELNLGWKDIVPDEILIPFNKWKESVVHLKNIRIPRWTNPLGLEDSLCDLVIFADASKEAFGIASYFRRYLRGGGGTSGISPEEFRKHCSISPAVFKAKVTPLQMMRNITKDALDHGDSIPRLELTAAKLAAQWRDTLVRDSGETFENVYLFSDSLTVLGWLSNFEKRFATFENFRIKFIRKVTKLQNWRHIPTNLNPADLCSKGIEANDYKRWSFLHNGPDFLKLPLSEWPPIRPIIEKDTDGPETIDVEMADFSPFELMVVGGTLEDVQVEAALHSADPWPLQVAAKQDTWRKKIRSIAIVRRVIMTLREKVRSKKEGIIGPRLRPRKGNKCQAKEKLIIFLSDEERDKAEYLLINAIQAMSFEKEMVTLLKCGIFSPNALNEMKVKNSSIAKLSPFLDQNNVMRAGGRCGKAEFLSYDSKYPIILPNHSDENVRSLIRGYHFKNMHCSKTQTYYALRQKYFILGGKTAVSHVLARCVICQRMNKLPSRQIEGDLPPERMELVAPFANSGVDVFGPFHLRHAGRGTRKKFVLMVCCMSTRAVALITLRDMTTSAVINALMRLNSQYPSLKKIYSDQGSNFRGADREIREAMETWNKKEFNQELEKINLEWIFGPAYCGSAGGAWERLIGMAKKLIRSIIGQDNADEDDFETLISAAAGIMNRRPLMQSSADVDDPLVLSPAHFLYPYVFTNSATSIMPPANDVDRLRRGWKASRSWIDEFWRRFQSEYLASLIKRRKTTKTDDLKVGDVVLINDLSESREYWPLGRIVEIKNEDTGHPRRFLVKNSQNGLLVLRDIQNLIPLELSD